MHFKVHVIDVKNQLQNYIWLLEDTDTQEVIVVDPTEGQLVIDYCQLHALKIKQIWLTHWHKDHIGGVPALLLDHLIPVYGPRAELSKIPMLSHPLDNDDRIQFNALKIDIFSLPGHTLGHIAYFIDELDLLFCGDTLFAMGCGRLFEGTAAQMYQSLNRLAALPPRTQVYCTHEYTLANAQFALSIEPDNKALLARYEQIQQLRNAGQMTLPSSIELELETNPFLRAESVEEFTRIRALKDHF